MVKLSGRTKQDLYYKIVATFLEIGELIYFGLLYPERSCEATGCPLKLHSSHTPAPHPRCAKTSVVLSLCLQSLFKGEDQVVLFIFKFPMVDI